MKNTEKAALFVAIRSITRIEEGIQDCKTKQEQIPHLSEFIEKAWDALIQPVKLKTAAKALFRKINAAALDEQNADNEEILFNYYLYAIADLIMFFIENDPVYLDSPNEWAMEVVRAIELGKLLGEPGNAVILTPEQLESIENSTLVKIEKAAQSKDKIQAEKVDDWEQKVLEQLRNN